MQLFLHLNKTYSGKVNFPARHELNRDSRVLESRRMGLARIIYTGKIVTDKIDISPIIPVHC